MLKFVVTCSQMKAVQQRETVSLGLYCYPVLMAADVLLYKATHVPVGNDQTQHMELMRGIARTFNSTYDSNIFPIPRMLLGTFKFPMIAWTGN